MTKPTAQELLALADEYEVGLKKCVASGYAEYGPDFQRRHQMVIDALRTTAAPDVREATIEECAKLVEDYGFQIVPDQIDDIVFKLSAAIRALARQAQEPEYEPGSIFK